MWKLFGLAIGLSMLALGTADAQQSVSPCTRNPTGGCAPVTQTTPLPVTVTSAISANTSATVSATLPTLAPGLASVYESLSGGLYVQQVYGTQIVDLTHGLPTNVVSPLPAGTNLLGHVLLDSGSTTLVTQPTAASLNATVVGTGTFLVQAAQSGSWTVTANQGGIWDIRNVTGTVSLPTGASTSALQSAIQTPITPASATATAGLLLAGQYNSTQATFTNGQQGALQLSSRGALLVATGADTFTIAGQVSISQTTPGTTNGVTPVPQRSSTTDISSAIVSGGTAQLLVGADATRRGLQIQNQSTDLICFAYSPTPVCGAAGTWQISATGVGSAGGSYTTPVGYPETAATYIIGATAGDKFTAVWW